MRRIEHPALFRQTLGLACQHPAQIISLQKMLGQLQDHGSINTLANYLELIAGAFLVEPIRKFSPQVARVRTSSPEPAPDAQAHLLPLLRLLAKAPLGA